VNGASVTGVNFTSTQQTWIISGAAGTGSVTMSLTGASSSTITANASGAYSFPGMANGSYTLTPSLSGYTFSPASQVVTVNGSNVTAAIFTATQQMWTISGAVAGTATGATIALTGASNATTTASAPGPRSLLGVSSSTFTFTGLANGTYTVTPSLSGYAFSPASQSLTISGASVTAVNFTATLQTWTLSGATGIAGATVALTGASSATTTASTSGAYSYSGLANGSYTLTPSLSGYTFTPASQVVTVSGASLTANFSAQAVPTGITIDATVSQDNPTASKSVSVSALSTVSGNELILAFVSTGSSSAGLVQSLAHVMVTGVSGGGLTWVLVNRTAVRNGTAEIWRAFSPAPLNGVSVTATLSQSAGSSMTVMSFAGVNTSGTNGSGAIGATASGNSASGAPNAALTTTRNNSWVFGVGTDAANAIARTPGAGQTIVHQYLAPTNSSSWVQSISSPTALTGSSVTISDSAPTSDPYNLSIVEILGASAPSMAPIGLTAQAATAKAAQQANIAAPTPSMVLAMIATGQAGDACSPGGLATLLGTQFTSGQVQSSTTSPLPAQLAGVQVLVNGVPAPLLLASSKQINFQCPVLPAGTVLEIQVESATSAATAVLQTVMQTATPLLFQRGAGNGGFVTITGTNQIATAATDGRPAKRGEYVTIHSSGLGEVVDGVNAGTAAPSNRLVPTQNKIKLVLGDVEIDPEFAGLAPGTVGLYQVLAQVPSEAPVGADVPLYLKITLPDGTTIRSNSVTVAVAEAAKK